MPLLIFGITKMTLLLITLLLSLKIQMGHSTPDISCDQTIKSSPQYHYEIACQDFSPHGYTNGTPIDECALITHSNTAYQWGWSFHASRICLDWVHAISLDAPTERSCSMKVKLTDGILDYLENQHNRVTGMCYDSFHDYKQNRNRAESHFGQSDTLARDTLAGTLWPE